MCDMLDIIYTRTHNFKGPYNITSHLTLTITYLTLFDHYQRNKLLIVDICEIIELE